METVIELELIENDGLIIDMFTIKEEQLLSWITYCEVTERHFNLKWFNVP